jgi:diketogulonate reductase-like aldo/keto reductase
MSLAPEPAGMAGPVEMPDIGLGTYKLRGDTCVEAVRTALDAGYSHVDTARMYGNEVDVGRGITASGVPRRKVFVATKVWHDSLGREALLDSARASRDDLGVDTLDLLYVHWPRDTYDPAETLPALAEARDRGLTRHVGVSNFTPDLLDEGGEYLDAPLLAHQVEMHPLCPQSALREYAAEAGHRLVAYCPVARGAVADVPEIVDVAEKHDATPAQVSIAWVLAKGAVPIPKSGTPAHIRENRRARTLDLDAADVERIDAVERRERLVDPADAPWNA